MWCLQEETFLLSLFHEQSVKVRGLPGAEECSPRNANGLKPQKAEPDPVLFQGPLSPEHVCLALLCDWLESSTPNPRHQ